MKQKEILINHETGFEHINKFLHKDLRDHIDVHIKTLKHLDIMHHQKVRGEKIFQMTGTDLVDAILMKIDYEVITARKERLGQ